MPVEGDVGLPGSGKTVHLVSDAVAALDAGMEVWANFRIGRRAFGARVLCCDVPRGWAPCTYAKYARRVGARGDVVAEGYFTEDVVEREGHVPTWVVEPATPNVLALAARKGYRLGVGFIQSVRANVVRSWEELIELRVERDVFGNAHDRRCDQNECDGCSKGIFVALDELNLWAPSRLWQELGIGVLTRWAYVRKDGMHVRWTAQHEKRIDTVAREVTDFIYTNRCIKLSIPVPFNGRQTLMIFIRRRWTPVTLSDKDRTNSLEGGKSKALDVRVEWNLPSILLIGHINTAAMDAYDTYEHVEASKHLAAPKAVSARGDAERPRAPVKASGMKVRRADA